MRTSISMPRLAVCLAIAAALTLPALFPRELMGEIQGDDGNVVINTDEELGVPLALFVKSLEAITGSKFILALSGGRVEITNQSGNAGHQGTWRSQTTVSRGVWHTIELIVSGQSAVGASDGSFRIFLDGQEISVPGIGKLKGVGQTGINWYASGAPTRLFSGLQMFLYWGGINNTKTANDYVDLGEFYITGKSASR